VKRVLTKTTILIINDIGWRSLGFACSIYCESDWDSHTDISAEDGFWRWKKNIPYSISLGPGGSWVGDCTKLLRRKGDDSLRIDVLG
jgi:hypothetical protein